MKYIFVMEDDNPATAEKYMHTADGAGTSCAECCVSKLFSVKG
jgi:hypothetical protein